MLRSTLRWWNLARRIDFQGAGEASFFELPFHRRHLESAVMNRGFCDELTEVERPHNETVCAELARCPPDFSRAPAVSAYRGRASSSSQPLAATLPRHAFPDHAVETYLHADRSRSGGPRFRCRA